MEQSEVNRLAFLKEQSKVNKSEREERKKAIKEAIQSGEVFSL